MADVTCGQFCFPKVAVTVPLPINLPAMSLDTPLSRGGIHFSTPLTRGGRSDCLDQQNAAGPVLGQLWPYALTSLAACASCPLVEPRASTCGVQAPLLERGQRGAHTCSPSL